MNLGAVIMEFIWIIVFIWIISKIFGGKSSSKSGGSGGGQTIKVPPSNKNAKCGNCRHDKFVEIDISEHERTNSLNGKRYMFFRYYAKCAKCGTSYREDSGEIKL